MRPKRPVRPPEPPPPIPAVVTPEDLAAVNAPEVDKMPAYSSPGKFEWKTPPPGPKGDKGDPGAPGVITRPITPAVTTDEIASGAVTEEKLSTDSVTQTKIAPNSVGWSEIRVQSLEPAQIKTLSGEPPLPGQVPVYDETGPNYWWFKWAYAAVRPLVPPVATGEIANGAVTPEKLSFVPGVERPLVPPIATDEIANGAVTLTKLDPTIPLVTRPITPPITTEEIAGGAVTTDRIGDSAVIPKNIADGAVTLTKLDPTIPLVTRPLVPPVVTEEIADGAVTKPKFGYKVVSITIPVGAISSSSPEDPDLVGGVILGYYPTGNQDQYVDNITVKLAGDIEIMLAGSAKAANTFNVVVLRA